MNWSLVLDRLVEMLEHVWASWITYLSDHPVQAISLTVNVVTAFFWLRSKVVLSKFLTGRWEGTLTAPETTNAQDHELSTVLVITEHAGRESTAYFMYTYETSAGIHFKGRDKLIRYLELPRTSLAREWSALFPRHAHQDLKQPQGLEDIDQSAFPPSYTWNCKITNIFFKPKISIVIVGNSETYSGYLQKF